jgi:5'-nucleotidase
MIKIVHFNDVYDIEEENGIGGVARFYTALKKHSQDDPLILFSGDLFSPSHCKYLIKNFLKVF